MALSTTAALSKDRATGATATMQHRHYAAIAAILKSIDDVDRLSEGDMEFVAFFFANRLENTNPRFDRQRFLKACGF